MDTTLQKAIRLMSGLWPDGERGDEVPSVAIRMEAGNIAIEIMKQEERLKLLLTKLPA